ncbi:hypothetical protein PoB_005622600 [Plakobranchus ocellatus]|uniref:Uncharacterized protein n=1 Tax=Plakobranchus ocellatus TaxID=259542 RepID=A0AAV4CAH8_9GAST|nr:hypothetical protein PoB_005622600 [Plakobranchus ocellatus]
MTLFLSFSFKSGFTPHLLLTKAWLKSKPQTEKPYSLPYMVWFLPTMLRGKVGDEYMVLCVNQGAGGRARTRNSRVLADLRADSLATMPPTPLFS